MRAVKYLNDIVYFEDVVKDIDFSSISYELKNVFLGQDNIYEADIDLAKNDTNLKSKTLFYKSIFEGLHKYLKEIEERAPLKPWMKFENHFVQVPGTQDPQMKQRCAAFEKEYYVVLFCLNTVNDGGFISLPNQNFSIHLQENTMLVFPGGKEYEYNIHKIGGSTNRSFIEMVVG
jgi:hypothetical protein